MLSTLNITADQTQKRNKSGTILSENKSRVNNTKMLQTTQNVIPIKNGFQKNFTKKVNPLHTTFKNPLKMQYNLNNGLPETKNSENIEAFSYTTPLNNILNNDLWNNNESKNEEINFAKKLLFTKEPTFLQDEFKSSQSSRRRNTNLSINNKNTVKINKMVKIGDPINKRSSSAIVKKNIENDVKIEEKISLGPSLLGVQDYSNNTNINPSSPLIVTKKPEIISPVKNIEKMAVYQDLSKNGENPYNMPSFKVNIESPEKKEKLKFHGNISMSKDNGGDSYSEAESRFSRRFIFEDDPVEEIEKLEGGARLVGQKQGEERERSKNSRILKSQEFQFNSSKSPKMVPDRLSAGNNPLMNQFRVEKKDNDFKVFQLSKPTLKDEKEDRDEKSITTALAVLEKNFELKEKELTKRIEELELKNRKLYDKKVEAEEKLRLKQKERLIDLSKKTSNQSFSELEKKNNDLEEENLNLKREIEKMKHQNKLYKGRIDFLEEKRFESEKHEGLYKELQDRVMTLESLKV